MLIDKIKIINKAKNNKNKQKQILYKKLLKITDKSYLIFTLFNIK